MSEEKTLEQRLQEMREERKKLDELMSDEAETKAEPQPAIEAVEPPKKKEKPAKEKKIKEPKPKKESKPKKEKKKIELKKSHKILLLVAGVVVLVGIVAGIINYAQTAYLRSYKAKYHIDFPKGIPEEFCDAYGSNQLFAGRLNILDNDVDVFAQTIGSKANFNEGSSFDTDQQLKSISFYMGNPKIENAFNTAEGFVNSNQKVSFTSIYGKAKEYQVVYAYYTNTNPADDNDYVFPYYAYGNLTPQSFTDFQDKINSRALYYTGYELSYYNSYLTISVPTDFMEDFRFVIVCAEIDKDFEPIKTTTENDKIHYPQKWYDANEQKNPYWLAKKWHPTIYTDEKQQHTEIVKE